MSLIDAPIIPHFSLHEQFIQHGYATCHVTPSLPRTWAAQIRSYASDLLDGITISPLAQAFPWLYTWYCEVVKGLADVTFSAQVALASMEQALTLHLSMGRGRQTSEEREREVNARPVINPHVSGVLFANTLPESHGGGLELLPQSKSPALITPTEGLFVLFQGGITKHVLHPVRRALDVCYAVLVDFADNLLRASLPHEVTSALYGKLQSGTLVGSLV